MDKFCNIGVYHLRLTTDLEFDLIEGFVKERSDQYIISHEVSHYHCYLVTDVTRKDLRSAVNEVLKLKGNGQFSIADVRKPQQMKKYILKDGNFRFRGYTEQEIKILRLCSNKKGMDKYSDELSVLEENFYSDKSITLESYMVSVVNLQLSYGMKPVRNRLQSYARYVEMKRSPARVRSYVRELLEPR
jgi:hypothetical protein